MPVAAGDAPHAAVGNVLMATHRQRLAAKRLRKRRERSALVFRAELAYLRGYGSDPFTQAVREATVNAALFGHAYVDPQLIAAAAESFRAWHGYDGDAPLDADEV